MKATTASVEAEIFTLIRDKKNKMATVNEMSKLLTMIDPILASVFTNLLFNLLNRMDSFSGMLVR